MKISWRVVLLTMAEICTTANRVTSRGSDPVGRLGKSQQACDETSAGVAGARRCEAPLDAGRARGSARRGQLLAVTPFAQTSCRFFPPYLLLPCLRPSLGQTTGWQPLSVEAATGDPGRGGAVASHPCRRDSVR
jgi:hypothetical protein